MFARSSPLNWFCEQTIGDREFPLPICHRGRHLGVLCSRFSPWFQGPPGPQEMTIAGFVVLTAGPGGLSTLKATAINRHAEVLARHEVSVFCCHRHQGQGRMGQGKPKKRPEPGVKCDESIDLGGGRQHACYRSVWHRMLFGCLMLIRELERNPESAADDFALNFGHSLLPGNVSDRFVLQPMNGSVRQC